MASFSPILCFLHYKKRKALGSLAVFRPQELYLSFLLLTHKNIIAEFSGKRTVLVTILKASLYYNSDCFGYRSQLKICRLTPVGCSRIANWIHTVATIETSLAAMYSMRSSIRVE
jgi:hypothetical protein